ncbi:uncharacterized protein B0I36DRAFT_353245 [Microdochium trichocladiopsis]|uniref:Azaphilone pigments biosynthesis cluster protein L N-terminal domain-containing protein n=1 Tax=Microdochium trichocladiopsis TaxID=1682393 RepID=A0A9P8XZV1_9PEZI|nr:uncharacterized protein B0I36DRAFT_353245 [Microdochium trichocladiopsis]KAH7025080.1 hypothetical protein B0I36DRAFT_353245 [Microdochium trichocladiopsis]
MAEVVGVISGVLTLATFALKSSKRLCKTIQEFPSHPRQVRELLDELSALNTVLHDLSQNSDLGLEVDLTALELALKQCKRSCDDVDAELQKYCSRSTEERTSFRDWAKLKCSSGDGIDGFRQQLIGYKTTVTVALAFATLHTSVATKEAVLACRDIITTATIDLQAHLQGVQTKLDSLSRRAEYGTDTEGPVRHRIEAELRSTEKGIQFCGDLSEAIQRIHIDFFGDQGSRSAMPDPLPSSEALFGEGLAGCLHHMRFTLEQLEKNRLRLNKSMTTNPRSPLSTEDEAASKRLQTEARTLRNCLEFCTNVDEVLESHISNIENHAKGNDIIQYMVSMNDKPLHGKNEGEGDRVKQAGGHFSDESFQQMSQDFTQIVIHERERHEQARTSASDSAKKPDTRPVPHSSFGERYGTGLPLGKRTEPVVAEEHDGKQPLSRSVNGDK